MINYLVVADLENKTIKLIGENEVRSLQLDDNDRYICIDSMSLTPGLLEDLERKLYDIKDFEVDRQLQCYIDDYLNYGNNHDNGEEEWLLSQLEKNTDKKFHKVKSKYIPPYYYALSKKDLKKRILNRKDIHDLQRGHIPKHILNDGEEDVVYTHSLDRTNLACFGLYRLKRMSNGRLDKTILAEDKYYVFFDEAGFVTVFNSDGYKIANRESR